MPAPVARPVMASSEITSKQQFPGTKFIAATKAGYRTVGVKATGVEEDEKIRRLTAKLYMFRNNAVDAEARLLKFF